MDTYEFYSISWYKFLLCQIKCSGGVDDLYTAAGKERETSKEKGRSPSSTCMQRKKQVSAVANEPTRLNRAVDRA